MVTVLLKFINKLPDSHSQPTAAALRGQTWEPFDGLESKSHQEGNSNELEVKTCSSRGPRFNSHHPHSSP